MKSLKTGGRLRRFAQQSDLLSLPMRPTLPFLISFLFCLLLRARAQTIPWGPPNEEKYIHGQLTTSPFDFKPGTTLTGAQQCLQPSSRTTGVVILTRPCVTPISSDATALLDKWTYNFTDNSVRTWSTPDSQPTSLCLDGGSLMLSPGSTLVGTQVISARCNTSADTQKWEWDGAFLKILNYNRWMSPAADQSGHFQLGVDNRTAVPVNFVLPPFTGLDTYTLQPTLAHSSDANGLSDIGDGPGPCQYGAHRAGTFYNSKECASQCKSEPKCLGFIFGISGGVGCCYLKAWFPPPQSTGNSGYSTYVKGTSDVASFPALALPTTQEAVNRRPTNGNTNGPEKSSPNNLGAIIGAICGGIAALLVLALLGIAFLLCRKRKRNKRAEKERVQDDGTGKAGFDDPAPSTKSMHVVYMPDLYPAAEPPNPARNDIGDALAPSWRAFSYQELRTATGDFASGNLLGEGAFGRVYRGALPDGSRIAVKALKAGPKGLDRREFLDELRALSNVRHRHLVALRGYCAVGMEEYFLALDLADQGNLFNVLQDKRNPVLSWESRIAIAVAAASGLSYLHNDADPPIIHRDIKSANILLDTKKIAQVADFGLARLMDEGDVGMTIQARGTFGYVAPEYVQEGLVSKKLDVYSFGVVLLELLTGLKAMHTVQPGVRRSLVDVVKSQYPGVDLRLNGNYSPAQASMLFDIAMACVVRHENRPDMSAVYRALQDLAQGSAGFGDNPRARYGNPVGSPVTPVWAGGPSHTTGSSLSTGFNTRRYGAGSNLSVLSGGESTGDLQMTRISDGR